MKMNDIYSKTMEYEKVHAETHAWKKLATPYRRRDFGTQNCSAEHISEQDEQV
jgi:hypothetical protein